MCYRIISIVCCLLFWCCNQHQEVNCIIEDFDYHNDSTIAIESYFDTCTQKYVDKELSYRENGIPMNISLYPEKDSPIFYSLFCDSLGRLVFLSKYRGDELEYTHVFNEKVFEILKKRPVN